MIRGSGRDPLFFQILYALAQNDIIVEPGQYILVSSWDEKHSEIRYLMDSTPSHHAVWVICVISHVVIVQRWVDALLQCSYFCTPLFTSYQAKVMQQYHNIFHQAPCHVIRWHRVEDALELFYTYVQNMYRLLPTTSCLVPVTHINTKRHHVWEITYDALSHTLSCVSRARTRVALTHDILQHYLSDGISLVVCGEAVLDIDCDLVNLRSCTLQAQRITCHQDIQSTELRMVAEGVVMQGHTVCHTFVLSTEKEGDVSAPSLRITKHFCVHDVFTLKSCARLDVQGWLSVPRCSHIACDSVVVAPTGLVMIPPVWDRGVCRIRSLCIEAGGYLTLAHPIQSLGTIDVFGHMVIKHCTLHVASIMVHAAGIIDIKRAVVHVADTFQSQGHCALVQAKCHAHSATLQHIVMEKSYIRAHTLHFNDAHHIIYATASTVFSLHFSIAPHARAHIITDSMKTSHLHTTSINIGHSAVLTLQGRWIMRSTQIVCHPHALLYIEHAQCVLKNLRLLEQAGLKMQYASVQCDVVDGKIDSSIHMAATRWVGRVVRIGSWVALDARSDTQHYDDMIFHAQRILPRELKIWHEVYDIDNQAQYISGSLAPVSTLKKDMMSLMRIYRYDIFHAIKDHDMLWRAVLATHITTSYILCDIALDDPRATDVACYADYLETMLQDPSEYTLIIRCPHSSWPVCIITKEDQGRCVWVVHTQKKSVLVEYIKEHTSIYYKECAGECVESDIIQWWMLAQTVHIMRTNARATMQDIHRLFLTAHTIQSLSTYCVVDYAYCRYDASKDSIVYQCVDACDDTIEEDIIRQVHSVYMPYKHTVHRVVASYDSADMLYVLSVSLMEDRKDVHRLGLSLRDDVAIDTQYTPWIRVDSIDVMCKMVLRHASCSVKNLSVATLYGAHSYLALTDDAVVTTHCVLDNTTLYGPKACITLGGDGTTLTHALYHVVCCIHALYTEHSMHIMLSQIRLEVLQQYKGHCMSQGSTMWMRTVDTTAALALKDSTWYSTYITHKGQATIQHSTLMHTQALWHNTVYEDVVLLGCETQFSGFSICQSSALYTSLLSLVSQHYHSHTALHVDTLHIKDKAVCVFEHQKKTLYMLQHVACFGALCTDAYWRVAGHFYLEGHLMSTGVHVHVDGRFYMAPHAIISGQDVALNIKHQAYIAHVHTQNLTILAFDVFCRGVMHTHSTRIIATRAIHIQRYCHAKHLMLSAMYVHLSDVIAASHIRIINAWAVYDDANIAAQYYTTQAWVTYRSMRATLYIPPGVGCGHYTYALYALLCGIFRIHPLVCAMLELVGTPLYAAVDDIQSRPYPVFLPSSVSSIHNLKVYIDRGVSLMMMLYGAYGYTEIPWAQWPNMKHIQRTAYQSVTSWLHGYRNNSLVGFVDCGSSLSCVMQHNTMGIHIACSLQSVAYIAHMNAPYSLSCTLLDMAFMHHAQSQYRLHSGVALHGMHGGYNTYFYQLCSIQASYKAHHVYDTWTIGVWGGCYDVEVRAYVRKLSVHQYACWMQSYDRAKRIWKMCGQDAVILDSSIMVHNGYIHGWMLLEHSHVSIADLMITDHGLLRIMSGSLSAHMLDNAGHLKTIATKVVCNRITLAGEWYHQAEPGQMISCMVDTLHIFASGCFKQHESVVRLKRALIDGCHEVHGTCMLWGEEVEYSGCATLTGDGALMLRRVYGKLAGACDIHTLQWIVSPHDNRSDLYQGRGDYVTLNPRHCIIIDSSDAALFIRDVLNIRYNAVSIVAKHIDIKADIYATGYISFHALQGDINITNSNVHAQHCTLIAKRDIKFAHKETPWYGRPHHRFPAIHSIEAQDITIDAGGLLSITQYDLYAKGTLSLSSGASCIIQGGHCTALGDITIVSLGDITLEPLHKRVRVPSRGGAYTSHEAIYTTTSGIYSYNGSIIIDSMSSFYGASVVLCAYDTIALHARNGLKLTGVQCGEYALYGGIHNRYVPSHIEASYITLCAYEGSIVSQGTAISAVESVRLYARDDVIMMQALFSTAKRDSSCRVRMRMAMYDNASDPLGLDAAYAALRHARMATSEQDYMLRMMHVVSTWGIASYNIAFKSHQVSLLYTLARQALYYATGKNFNPHSILSTTWTSLQHSHTLVYAHILHAQKLHIEALNQCILQGDIRATHIVMHARDILIKAHREVSSTAYNRLELSCTVALDSIVPAMTHQTTMTQNIRYVPAIVEAECITIYAQSLTLHGSSIQCDRLLGSIGMLHFNKVYNTQSDSHYDVKCNSLGQISWTQDRSMMSDEAHSSCTVRVCSDVSIGGERLYGAWTLCSDAYQDATAHNTHTSQYIHIDGSLASLYNVIMGHPCAMGSLHVAYVKQSIIDGEVVRQETLITVPIMGTSHMRDIYYSLRFAHNTEREVLCARIMQVFQCKDMAEARSILKNMMYYSRCAYADIAASLDGAIIKEHFTLVETGMKVLIVENKKGDIIIALSGTPLSWDINMWRTLVMDDLAIACGKEPLSVRYLLEHPIFLQYWQTHKTITLTGHSRGAGVSVCLQDKRSHGLLRILVFENPLYRDVGKNVVVVQGPRNIMTQHAMHKDYYTLHGAYKHMLYGALAHNVMPKVAVDMAMTYMHHSIEHADLSV